LNLSSPNFIGRMNVVDALPPGGRATNLDW
jgi:hypothetical protein